ncbi:izumo sperm-egg fusion protein 3 [Nannospalax galili]|uniref:IZUMO family member 3 n=1 Tax=Nannospalax galili TaxID=1026970 RepID=A0A8C6R2K0_NANGA|nr:izumo sperm-egg fusion protein 3 [Nannospalax galili]
MGDLLVFFLLPLSLAAFHEVRSCLECDPKFIEDVRTLLGHLIPVEVPGRTQLLERQFKEITHLSFKVSHEDTTLRLLAVPKVVELRMCLKDELHRLGNETWTGVFIIQGKLLEVRGNLESKLKETIKSFSEVACSEDCITIEGPVLDCWTCLRMTTGCFRGDYCKEENPKKAENREIVLFLILMTEAVILASAVLLFHFCVSHRRKMNATRRTLKKYLEKKLEELVGMVEKEDERKDLEFQKSNTKTQTGDPSNVDSELQTGT